jgi:exopolysaccharide production protein ExoQ
MLARAPHLRRAAARAVAAPGTREAVGGAMAVMLSILFWSIFYQNLPWSLDGFASSGPTQQSNVGDRIIKICMILISTYVIVGRWAVTRSVLKEVNVGLAALLILAPLSAAWSIEPTATLLRFTSLAAIVLTCFAISVAGWHRMRFQQLALWPLMLILLASLGAGILYPDRIAEIGTDVSQLNAWHGITHGKNEFGMMSSMAALMCVNRWLAREGRTFWAVVGTAISLLCLVLSRSNTSMLATLIGTLCMVLVMRVPVVRQRFSRFAVISIAATITLYELVIQNVIPGVNTLLAPILSMTGKDVTFSARSIIWGVIKEHIQGAPYLGSGYGAYWLGPVATSPSYVFVGLMNFYPTEAHNGYLDIINDMGIVGLGCLLLFVIWYIRQALLLMPYDRSQAALYLAILFQETVMNMSESDFFSRTSTFSILLLAVTCLSRALRDARLMRNPRPRPAH